MLIFFFFSLLINIGLDYRPICGTTLSEMMVADSLSCSLSIFATQYLAAALYFRQRRVDEEQTRLLRKLCVC